VGHIERLVISAEFKSGEGSWWSPVGGNGENLLFSIRPDVQIANLFACGPPDGPAAGLRDTADTAAIGPDHPHAAREGAALAESQPLAIRRPAWQSRL